MYNFIFSVATSLLFISIEILFRHFAHSASQLNTPKDYIEIILISVLLSFTNKKSAFIIGSIFFLFYLIQVLHYTYFGFLLFPIEVYKFFTEQAEIFVTLRTLLPQLLPPTVLIIFFWLLFIIINRQTLDRKTYPKLPYLFIGIFLFAILKANLSSSKSLLGSSPNLSKSVLKNSLYVTKYFLGKTLPQRIFNIYTVKPWMQEPFAPRENNIQTVVFIIGESLTSKHMSVYGYNKNTTPFLSSVVKDKQYIIKNALAAGVYTETSVPALINIAQKPNAIEHILTQETNLFAMAKHQGFTTHFITAQKSDWGYINSYLGVNSIDHFINPKNKPSNSINLAAPDDFLVHELKKINLSTSKNFIVLNMAGSHEPYQSQYPSSKNIFGNTLLDQYDNSVHYTDHIIQKIIATLSSAPEKTTVVFTSDHGQHVGKNGYGKGNLKISSDYMVPFFIHTMNHNINNDIKRFLSPYWISHYKISKLVAYSLGYNTLHPSNSDTSIYINGGELSGNSGYAEIKFDGTLLNLSIH